MRYDFAPAATRTDLWRLAPAIYLLDAVTRVEALGHDLTRLLASLGLTRNQLEASGKFVTCDQYYGIIAYCINELNVPEVGFIQEQHVPMLFSGVAGLAFATSATFGAAIEVALKYPDLTAVPVALSLHSESGTGRLRMGKLQHEATYPHGWHRVWAVETMMSSVYGLLQQAGVADGVQQATFRHPSPAHRVIYDRTFQCDLRFDADEDELVFNADILNLRQASADAMTCELALRQCETSVRKLANATNLLDQIEGIILSSSPQLPRLSTVAERLHISDRTLQRRLGELRTSYREITNRVRHSMAIDMLRETDLPVKEVAYLLGYTESANFSQAFKLIAGVSPANFRY